MSANALAGVNWNEANDGDKTPAKYSEYKWPMTQRYEHNPLFVGFPSQLFDKDGVGTLYTADPSAHVWKVNGKEVLYVYPSHDQEPPRGCDRMDKYHVFSTTNMKDWTDHGEILNASQVEWGRSEGLFMWAPDCAYSNGTYYFYFPHPSGNADWNKTWKISVAISKYPDRDFKSAGYIHDLDSIDMIDPCVFVDDDGSAYLYFGGGGKCEAAKLKKNMTEIAAPAIHVEGLHDFHEAAWVFNRNGTYYLTYSDNHDPRLGGNHLCYATSKSPMGPWTYQGIYMYPHGYDTAHGSVVKYKGKWYQFYHTGNFGNRGNLRSVCFDELTFTRDGKINVVNTWGKPYGGKMSQLTKTKTIRLEAEHYNTGGSHKGFFKRPSTTKFIFGDQRTSEMKTGAEGNVDFLKSMTTNEWVRYSVNVKQPGKYTVRVHQRVTRGQNPKIHVGVDGCWAKDPTKVTSPLNQWGDTEVVNVDLTAGEHYLEWRGVSGTMDIDYIEVVS